MPGDNQNNSNANEPSSSGNNTNLNESQRTEPPSSSANVMEGVEPSSQRLFGASSPVFEGYDVSQQGTAPFVLGSAASQSARRAREFPSSVSDRAIGGRVNVASASDSQLFNMATSSAAPQGTSDLGRIPIASASQSIRQQRQRHDLGDTQPSQTSFPVAHRNPEVQQSATPELIETVSVIWGTDIELNKTQELFTYFLRHFTLNHLRLYRDSGSALDANLTPYYPRMLEQIRLTEMYHLSLNVEHLRAFDQTRDLEQQLIAYPQEIIPIMDECVARLYEELFPEDQAPPSIQVRPFNLEENSNLRMLDPNDIDKLISIKGIVIRTTNIVPDMRTAYFKCIVCGHSVTSENIKGRIEEPDRCPREGCGLMRTMSIIHNRCVFSDKQIIRMQETPDSIPEGQTPHTVTLMVYDSLVDAVRPGDRITVTGIFRTNPVRVNSRQRSIKSLFRTFVDVVHIAKTVDGQRDKAKAAEDLSTADFVTGSCDLRSEEEEQEIERKAKEIAALPELYDTLSASLAPSIWGLPDVKKGLLLQLFGGVTKFFDQANSTARFRGDIHVLMAGDPGVSKSQLLQYVHKLAPRGMYTSGKGSSAVGLTAYITRDPETRQVVLESGALVLSDGGICCIDEFDKMSDATRSILHEAMEQQTVSIAKRGIIASLNARTSILASANPIDSKYNSNLSIVQNLNLPPTLLSRFDLIYLLLDRPNEGNDLRLAKHLISLYLANPTRDQAASLGAKDLSLYISYVREHIRPEISESASKLIVDGYVKMRRVNGSGQGTVSATTRQLESIIRLAEAHAKMRFSDTVEEQDAVEAIRLIKEALISYATDPVTGRIDMDLISTGKSASARNLTERLKKEIQSFFGSETQYDFQTLLTNIQKNATIPVNANSVIDALDALDSEGFLQITGNPRKGRCVLRKLAA